MNEILSIDQLTYTYPETAEPSLRDISLQVREGEFVLLLGASGSGKSTFLRAVNGLIPRFYGGRMGGSVRLAGTDISMLSQREIVCATGFLQQDPERQLLLETVERELVFGLENIGVPASQMRSRLAEISQLFGLGPLLEVRQATLSGGEKQRVALASVLALYPRLLLLDEPTSQLDPVHAEEVLHAVRRLNEEWGLTVLLCEHRVERCFHLADRILQFEAGRIVFDGSPAAFAESAREKTERRAFLPPVTRHLLEEGGGSPLPLTVKAARAVIASREIADSPKRRPLKTAQAGHREPSGNKLLSLEQGWAGYSTQGNVIRGLSLSIHEGDRLVILGENGTGKSTLAKLLAGVHPLAKGELHLRGTRVDEHAKQGMWQQIGYLAQNPNDYFLQDTVEGELDFGLDQLSLTREERQRRKRELVDMLGLVHCRDRHPHDLSGGEKQRLALALLLLIQPDILILDEPTRGLDHEQKAALIDILRRFSLQAILIITHDVEFAQAFANRVCILHRGELVADGTPDEVFGQSFAYMPQVYKLYRSGASVRT